MGSGSPVVTTLAAKFAVGITSGLVGLVVATGHIGFGVVLLDPGDDVFGVQRDAIAAVEPLGAQFGSDEADGVSQQELQDGIGNGA